MKFSPVRASAFALSAALGLSLVGVPGVASAAPDAREALDAAVASSLVSYNEGVVSTYSVFDVSEPGYDKTYISVSSGVKGSDLSAGVSGFDLFWSVQAPLVGGDPGQYTALAPSGGKVVSYRRLSELSPGWDSERVRKIVLANVRSLGGSSSSLVPVVSFASMSPAALREQTMLANPAGLVASYLEDVPGATVSSAPSEDGGTVFTIVPPAAQEAGPVDVQADASGRILGLEYMDDKTKMRTEFFVDAFGPDVEVPGFASDRVDTAYPRLASEYSDVAFMFRLDMKAARDSIRRAADDSASGAVTKSIIRKGIDASNILIGTAYKVRGLANGYSVSAALAPKARELFGPLCTSFTAVKKKLVVKSC